MGSRRVEGIHGAGRMRAQDAASGGPEGTSRRRGGRGFDLLRRPRPDATWAGSVRQLVNERPEDLLAAWKSLTPKERLDVLAHWKRSATAPGIAGDLDGAMERAKDPDLRFILHALREFTP
jgi:hypothetical protein